MSEVLPKPVEQWLQTDCGITLCKPTIEKQLEHEHSVAAISQEALRWISGGEDAELDKKSEYELWLAITLIRSRARFAIEAVRASGWTP